MASVSVSVPVSVFVSVAAVAAVAVEVAAATVAAAAEPLCSLSRSCRLFVRVARDSFEGTESAGTSSLWSSSARSWREWNRIRSHQPGRVRVRVRVRV